MTKSALAQLKEEQFKMLREQQRVMQTRSSEQLKYPYGPWREVLYYPVALAMCLVIIGGLLGYALVKLVPMLP
jgi:hypothetical protein